MVRTSGSQLKFLRHYSPGIVQTIHRYAGDMEDRETWPAAVHAVTRNWTDPLEGKGYPLQYSGLENPIDCEVHGVTKSWTRLSNFHLH